MLPCCYSFRRIAIITAQLDMIIGWISFILCVFASFCGLVFGAKMALGEERIVFWYGVNTVALMGIASLLSADKQIDWIDKDSQYKKRPRAYAAKFCLFLVIEILGLVVPHFCIPNYQKNLDVILADSPLIFGIFLLLKFNVITVLLLIFQLYSFLIIRYYINNEAQSRSEALEAVLVEPGAPTVICKQKRSTDIPMREIHSKSIRKPEIYASDSSDFESEEPEFGESGSEGDSGEQMVNVTHQAKVTGSKREFKILKNRCLTKNSLYEDPDFPACLESALGSVQWKRPHEICKSPKFISNGVSRFDVKQGKIGDCYFLAALANLTLNEKLFNRVVPKDNCWENGRPYAGICHFRFYFHGAWKDVIIDDRLPTRDGKRICMTSEDKNEFWSSLLEKAYAKLRGGYQVLNKGGNAGDAMVELTGGSAAKIPIRSPGTTSRRSILSLIERALKAGHLVTCSTHFRNNERDAGLTPEHAYSVSDMKRIDVAGRGQVGLIRIRNPWGNHVEWKGDWSDIHHLWDLVDRSMRKELKLRFAQDGEFWFPIKEFAEYFDLLEICYLKSV